MHSITSEIGGAKLLDVDIGDTFALARTGALSAVPGAEAGGSDTHIEDFAAP
jgi:hypothetical protein